MRPWKLGNFDVQKTEWTGPTRTGSMFVVNELFEFSRVNFFTPQFFTSFLISTSNRNNTRCYEKPLILTHFLEFDSITFLANPTWRNMMSVLFQVLWSVVFIYDACPNFWYSSDSIQIAINQTRSQHNRSNCVICTLPLRSFCRRDS